MKIQNPSFNEHEVLHLLKHYLPEQASLKDFIHQNTLQAFQKLKFNDALITASETFGYKVCLKLGEYRDLYKSKRIREDILQRAIAQRKGADQVKDWVEKLCFKKYEFQTIPRIGRLRAKWKKQYQI